MSSTVRRSQVRPHRESRTQLSRRKLDRSQSPADLRPISANGMNATASSSGTANNFRKKKKQSSLTSPTISSVNHSRQNQSHNQDQEDECLQPQALRRTRSKAKASGTRVGSELGTESGRPTFSMGKKENDRSSRSREPNRLHKRPASPDAIEADDESPAGYTGPLAFAEFSRLKAEVEKLKEQLHHSKKTIHKQSKVIDELRQEVSTVSKFSKEQIVQVEKLKNKFKKSEELLGNIEVNLQCHICLDTLLKPYTLSPCGHVLCQGCLQNWFRAAPAAEDDMDEDDDPLALVYRRKACPCCRTIVRTRPIPLFIVKSIATAFNKTKSPSSPRLPSPPPDADPWVGIFPDQDETMSSEEDLDEDDDDDDDDDGWAYNIIPGYGSNSETESYDGDYARARWQPPSVHIDPQDYALNDLDEHDFGMLRRGATVEMIELFSMKYSHSDGLSVVVDDGNIVYLGWNIVLHPSDYTGEDYIDYIVNDIFERGERWQVDDDGEFWVAWKLVPVDEDESFETTDSEAWEACEEEEEEEEE